MIHLEKLDPAKTHYIVRHFSEPIGPIDRVSGQPWKKYDGACVLTIHGDVGEVKAICSVPTGAFFELREKLVKDLKLIRLVGERWRNRNKDRVELQLHAQNKS